MAKSQTKLDLAFAFLIKMTLCVWYKFIIGIWFRHRYMGL